MALILYLALTTHDILPYRLDNIIVRIMHINYPTCMHKG